MYAKEVNEMVWSYSRLTSFEQCKYQFYLNYIVNDDSKYMPEGNFYAELGTFVHSILEKVFKNELSVDDAAQYFVDHFDDNVFYKVKQSIIDKSVENCADYFANLTLGWLKNYEIVGVEQKVGVDINKRPFIGYIDLLLRDKRTGDFTIVDHKSAKYPLSKKTGKVLKASEHSFQSYKKQMYLYCCAVHELYGVYPKWIVWNHFKDGEYVRIPFDENEYKEAVAWFDSMVRKIHDEEDFGETENFFYCHNLCAFRNSCEYASMSKE